MSEQPMVVAALEKMREPIAEYQDAKGISKTEQVSFINLMTSLFHYSYNAMLTILTMLYNLLPLVEGFMYIIRFALDKLIDIFNTTDTKEKILKILLFIGELVIIIFLTILFTALILAPIFHLTLHFVGKVFTVVWKR